MIVMRDALIIRGGTPLNGDVTLHGAKNAVLPLLLAGTLSEEKVEIEDCPHISDVDAMLGILRSLGVDVAREDRRICVCGCAKYARADKELARVMRSSMFMLGALISTVREVHMPLPGGCDIGARPLDIHVDGFRAMGARVECGADSLDCYADRLRGADIVMRYPSVGATENLMMCASLADGVTRLINCAREPEIVCLAKGLKAMGASIAGEGTSVMTIEGKESLHGAKLSPCGDRIVAGTLIAACAVAGGDIKIYGIDGKDCQSVIDVFCSDSCRIDADPVCIRVRSDGRVRARNVCTAPFPLFPTDMQAQLMAAMCFSDGVSAIDETVFERRFSHARELVKLGADISLDGGKATVRGCASTHTRLRGADMYARDLRGGAGLAVAALGAEGTSRIFNLTYIDRGYESLEALLSGLGADVKREAT